MIQTLVVSLFEPAHEIMVLIAYANSEGSGETAHLSPEPSLFAHMKYGSRRRARPKTRHLAPLDGCACVKNEFTEDEKCHNLMSWLISFYRSYFEDKSGGPFEFARKYIHCTVYRIIYSLSFSNTIEMNQGRINEFRYGVTV